MCIAANQIVTCNFNIVYIYISSRFIFGFGMENSANTAKGKNNMQHPTFEFLLRQTM
jgi:hypothetical protein